MTTETLAPETLVKEITAGWSDFKPLPTAVRTLESQAENLRKDLDGMKVNLSHLPAFGAANGCPFVPSTATPLRTSVTCANARETKHKIVACATCRLLAAVPGKNKTTT